ncbi:Alb1-domain-containing protein [Madurella fahalii]|uniref:Alb1-domain-containing protein n=1 Tax=Madurella fahalii TaxID=1157608 RepID=A0ABQ0G947_9PEZI
MAKGSISKGKRAPSVHSRAARRATSPSIDTDKSLKNVRAPQESVDQRPAVLAAHRSGGVNKKTKTGRKAVMSSKARRRHEKSMDRAEAIIDRRAVKVQKSKGHARVIGSRKKTWEEINRQVLGQEGQPKLSKKAKAKAEEDAMVAAFYADDDGDAEMEGAEDAADTPGGSADATPAQPVSMTPVPAEDDEIL